MSGATPAKPERTSFMTAKVLLTGKTHNTNGHDGAAHSSDGFLNIKMPQPHPAAEDLFGAAWSACYMGAIELAAAQKKIKLPPEISIDAEIKLNLDGSSFFPHRASRCQHTGPRSRGSQKNWFMQRTYLPILQGHARQYRR